jgi:hypothetical protein
MPPKGFKCKQCGHCCLNLYDAFSTSATDLDIKMWEQEGRDDILEWVDPIHIGSNQYVYDIWISPVTHDDVNRCPWLRKLPNQKNISAAFMILSLNIAENIQDQENMPKGQNAGDLIDSHCLV